MPPGDREKCAHMHGWPLPRQTQSPGPSEHGAVCWARGVGRRLAGGKVYGGFKTFLLRGNVVDLAVAVVVGAAFGSVVQALVKT